MEKIKHTIPKSMRTRHPFLKAMVITFACFVLILIGYFLTDTIDKLAAYIF